MSPEQEPLSPQQPPAAETDAVSPPTKTSRTVRPGGRKRGPKPGSKVQSNKTYQDWYICCRTYRNLKHKMSQTSFLTSALSGDSFQGTKSEQQSFGRFLNKYDEGLLQPSSRKRKRTPVYEELQQKLREFLNERAKHFRRNRCGLSWDTIRHYCKTWANEMGILDFCASDGWISNTLKRLEEESFGGTNVVPDASTATSTQPPPAVPRTLAQAEQLIQLLDAYNEKIGLSNESRCWLQGYVHDLRSHPQTRSI